MRPTLTRRSQTWPASTLTEANWLGPPIAIPDDLGRRSDHGLLQHPHRDPRVASIAVRPAGQGRRQGPFASSVQRRGIATRGPTRSKAARTRARVAEWSRHSDLHQACGASVESRADLSRFARPRYASRRWVRGRQPVQAASLGRRRGRRAGFGLGIAWVVPATIRLRPPSSARYKASSAAFSSPAWLVPSSGSRAIPIVTVRRPVWPGPRGMIVDSVRSRVRSATSTARARRGLRARRRIPRHHSGLRCLGPGLVVSRPAKAWRASSPAACETLERCGRGEWDLRLTVGRGVAPNVVSTVPSLTIAP